MKILGISDLHGTLPKITNEEFDVLCICGDLFPLKIQNNIPRCKSWLEKKFIKWCESILCDHVLLIAGNHDKCFERTFRNDIDSIFKNTKIHYLENDLIEIDGIKFYGTPYCTIFGNWAFMRDDENLSIIFDNIPENIDVLLTHDAPYGTSDVCLQKESWITEGHLGNKPLRDAIITKSPKFNFHGHLHSSNHSAELLNNTEVYNVSLLDEKYKLTYNPLKLEL